MGADWFERNLRAAKRAEELTDDHRRCLDLLSVITEPSGIYNLPCPIAVIDSVSLWANGGVSVLLNAELATFDSDRLTRLVLAAHLHHVRVAISPWLPHLDKTRARRVAHHLASEYARKVGWDDPQVGVGIMELTLHPRAVEGEHRYQWHPGIVHLRGRCEALNCRVRS